MPTVADSPPLCLACSLCAVSVVFSLVFRAPLPIVSCCQPILENPPQFRSSLRLPRCRAQTPCALHAHMMSSVVSHLNYVGTTQPSLHWHQTYCGDKRGVKPFVCPSRSAREPPFFSALTQRGSKEDIIHMKVSTRRESPPCSGSSPSEQRHLLLLESGEEKRCTLADRMQRARQTVSCVSAETKEDEENVVEETADAKLLLPQACGPLAHQRRLDLLICCSGGADSTALLHSLCRAAFSSRKGRGRSVGLPAVHTRQPNSTSPAVGAPQTSPLDLHLSVVYFDHKQRPIENKKEEDLVHSVAQLYGIPFYVCRLPFSEPQEESDRPRKSADEEESTTDKECRQLKNSAAATQRLSSVLQSPKKNHRRAPEAPAETPFACVSVAGNCCAATAAERPSSSSFSSSSSSSCPSSTPSTTNEGRQQRQGGNLQARWRRWRLCQAKKLLLSSILGGVPEMLLPPPRKSTETTTVKNPSHGSEAIDTRYELLVREHSGPGPNKPPKYSPPQLRMKGYLEALVQSIWPPSSSEPPQLLPKHVGVCVFAHHRDDQVETVLLKLLRGAHIANWRGMRYVTDLQTLGKSRELEQEEGDVDACLSSESRKTVAVSDLPALYVWRPLLNVTKTTLCRYLTAIGGRWVDDSSNRSLKYTRNRIRHRLLPAIRDTISVTPSGLGREPRGQKPRLEREDTTGKSSSGSDYCQQQQGLGETEALEKQSGEERSARKKQTLWSRCGGEDVSGVSHHGSRQKPRPSACGHSEPLHACSVRYRESHLLASPHCLAGEAAAGHAVHDAEERTIDPDGGRRRPGGTEQRLSPEALCDASSSDLLYRRFRALCTQTAMLTDLLRLERRQWSERFHHKFFSLLSAVSSPSPPKQTSTNQLLKHGPMALLPLQVLLGQRLHQPSCCQALRRCYYSNGLRTEGTRNGNSTITLPPLLSLHVWWSIPSELIRLDILHNWIEQSTGGTVCLSFDVLQSLAASSCCAFPSSASSLCSVSQQGKEETATGHSISTHALSTPCRTILRKSEQLQNRWKLHRAGHYVFVCKCN